jgi:NTP pyrophosphatase (non-canonical NTP hydrolase)
VGTVRGAHREEVDQMKLNEMRDAAHGTSRAKGWYDGKDAERNIPEMLALIHSEVSEALEDHRDGNDVTKYKDVLTGELFDSQATEGPLRKPVGFPSELADIIIRVGDLAGYRGIDLEREVAEKMAFNMTRPHRHGGKRA